MIDSKEALAAILDAMQHFGTETVPSSAARGRVLAETVAAERDQPPHDRVMMDGVALRSEALAAGARRFRIAATAHAGDPVTTLSAADDCIEVMTGAVLPEGSDCVIPVERIAVAQGHATIEDGYQAEPRQFVHAQGSDHVAGHTLLESGRRITPLDVALIAAAGRAEVAVARQPVVRVISTGNELVPAGEPVEPHRIRLSNGPALMAMLDQQDYRDCRHEHLVDEPEQLRSRLAVRLDEADVLMLSGGVSMGKADFVPRVLAELGVTVVFHGIAQRPGKPMWFGTGAAGQAVFALPGNPVSTLTCCRHYVLPALLHASGAAPQPPGLAVLAGSFTFRPDLTCLLPVALASGDDGRLLAEPRPTNTSGDFTSLADTDGYVELARGESEFPAGSVQPLYYWSAI